MGIDTPSDADRQHELTEDTNIKRREALIKLGKYTAYAAPIILATASAAQGAPISAPSPTPGPSPVPVSDIRLKRDIVLVSRLHNGIGLYRYKYLWSDAVYVGVMAQEVARVVPEAVLTGPDGYLRVDYGRLGTRLQTWEEWLEAGAEASTRMAA